MSFETDLIAVRPRLKRFAYKLQWDPSESEDLLQDTLLRVWDRRDQFVDDGKDGSFRRWCFTIMYSRHISRHRYEHARRSVIREWPTDINGNVVDDITFASENSPEVATSSLVFRDVVRALALLTIEQRAAILMVGVDGLRYGKAAEIAGVPIGTIRSRLSRGRTALRESCKEILQEL